MAFVNMHIFSLDFLHFDTSLLLLTVTLRGVSNKHCLLSFFSFFSPFLDEIHVSKQNSPRFNAAFCGITSGVILFAKFHKKVWMRTIRHEM